MLNDPGTSNDPSSKAPGPKGHEAETVSKSGNQKEAVLPSISLPKGGGAIKGIGEKFGSNPVTGTGTMSVPLPTSPGRSNFGPQLTLSYDSGSGNSVFGIGWHLSLPAITRKTDKGLPQYLDADESDVFILSGAEDLVPVLVETPGGWQKEDLPPRNVAGESFQVSRYRPRIEGIFSRIERWTSLQTGETHWRSITRDNVTTLYGKDDNSRVFAPATNGQPKRIFSWLICESYDDKGNAIAYQYVAENNQNVDLSAVNERNRSRDANRHIKSIKYGNRVSRLLQPDLDLAEWMFTVVFDYDEGHYQELPLNPALSEAEQHRFVRAAEQSSDRWSVRPDPFSVYRSRFEVRTYRRCHRVLMFHHFAELGTEACLVGATEFDYADLDYSLSPTVDEELTHQGSTRFASIIHSITHSGFVRDTNQPVVTINGVDFVTYLKKSIPPVEFIYSKARVQEEIRTVDAQNIPAGLDNSNYQWVDLDGEGISGILTNQAGALFYKSNLGNGEFGPIAAVPTQPSLVNLRAGRQQLIDLAGDGQLDLVAFGGPSPGFYERTEDEGWETFRTFNRLPSIQWDEPNLRFVDLNGDGHADVLITEDDVFTWYPSLAEDGFDSPVRVTKPFDEERGPRLVLADGTQSIYLADMCGDGLPALVRIRNGEICYWPNTGYGRFGSKVTMENSPWFDLEDQFSQQRVRIADIDGSGANDVIYLARNGVRLYFNRSGNGWSAARTLGQSPPIDNVAAVTTVDLLGNGTACLVWSSPLPANARSPLRYIDLMGQKPHLLVGSANNLGAETSIEYAPSTKFYLADKQAGKPWITKLPFPVHVVERVETFDRISGNRFVTRYDYHHGYFDGIEREFRGFGLVEQRDTEEFAALNVNQQFPTGTNIDASSHVPPVLTRTWFHTGAFLSAQHISDYFAGFQDDLDQGEYYREPGLTDVQARELLLDDTVLPDGLSADEEREACRALKGLMLRQEIFAEDDSEKARHPYTVSEQNFTIKLVQPRSNNKHAVFFTHPREALNYHYEREPTDPRLTHALTFEVDEFGNVRKEATLAYGRRAIVTVIDALGNVSTVSNPGLAVLSLKDQLEQTATLITYRESDFTNPISEDDNYRGRALSDRRTFELTGLILPGGQNRFTFSQLLAAATNAAPLAYEASPTPGLQEKRLIEQQRKLYRRNDLSGPLLLHQLESLALPFESLQLAFTPGLIANVFAGLVTDATLENEAHYVHSEGDSNWWIPSGREFYISNSLATPAQELAEARSHFFLTRRQREPFHTNAVPTETVIDYDAHDLLVLETRDAMGNRITAGERDIAGNITIRANDYRVLKPRQMMDPNRNRSEVAYDALGLVVGTAVRGKPEDAPQLGDTLSATFRPDLTLAEIALFTADPTGPFAATLLDTAGSRIVYDLTAYMRGSNLQDKPAPFAATLTRETHASDPIPAGGLKIRIGFAYSDGFGRQIQKKVQAEPGPVPRRDPLSGKILLVGGQPSMTSNDVSPRWVGTGWTVFNNKGKAVRKYESFFTDRHEFEFDVRIGVSMVLFFDPIDRVVGTLHPQHAWSKDVFSAWQQETWDLNDTVLLADPRTDSDVGDFFQRLSVSEYLPTWHTQRQGGALGTDEQNTALKAAIHANTPAIAHSDPLGRTFLTEVHNKFKFSDSPPAAPPIEEFYATRIRLDIEGNQREITDAVDRLVVLQTYDILGNRIHQQSMEAGAIRMLKDVAGKLIYTWDSRDQRIHTTYDQLRRPVQRFLQEGAAAEIMVERIVYGETQVNPEASNQRGKVTQWFDQAGVVTNSQYDFKDNRLSTERQLAQEYRTNLNWLVAVPLEPQVYTSATQFDALNRPTALVSPDNSIIRPFYNEASLLERVEVNLQGAANATTFVTDIDYDAKGQRILITLANGVSTSFEYDPVTFRLARLVTERNAADFPDDCPQPPPVGSPGCQVQDLKYTYDAAGNLTHIRDDAQQLIYFRNKRVEASADYTYDATYRLLEAAGREHLGQVGVQPNPPTAPGAFNDFHTQLDHPGDGNAMGTYLERYIYDAVGNILSMQHRGADPANPGWNRAYAYNEVSQLEAAKRSNRLTSTTIGGTTEVCGYAGSGGIHGNMTSMSHLSFMEWDYRDQLRATSRQVVNAGTPETTWYVYDNAGQRVRKITDRQASAGQVPTRMKERIYLAGFEIYRDYQNDGVTVTFERETLHVIDKAQRVAIVETRIQGTEPGVPPQLIRYQFTDHLSSTSLELDEQAQIICYEEYYPFGSTSYQAVRNQLEAHRRYRHTGKERDDENGLYYYGARYYASWLGKWTSCDKQGTAVDVNFYTYCHNRPTTMSDPDGNTPGLGLPPPVGPPPPPPFLMTPPPPPPVVAPPPPVVAPTPPPVVPNPGAGTGVATRAATGLGGATIAAVGAFLLVMLTPSNAFTKYEWSTVDPVTHQKRTFGSESQLMDYLNKQNREKRIAPGAADPNTTVKAPGQPQAGGPSKDPPPADPSPRIAPGATGKSDPVKAPGKSDTTEITMFVSQKSHSADKVPYTIRGTHTDFAAIVGTSVYLLKDKQGHLLYVGEGVVWDRLRSHLSDPEKTPWFGEIAQVEIKATGLTKKEAHALEQDLIQQLDPKYNKDRTPYETNYPGGLYGQDLPRAQKPMKFEVELGKK